MSAKQSRSEIESAVTGRARPSVRNRKQRSDSLQLQLDPLAARRQRVIGGDLNGVSKRARSGTRFGDFRQANYANWVAAGLVVLILAVFFWPQSNDDAIKEVTGPAQLVDSAPYYSESRVDEPQIVAAEQSFTHETDLDRAAEFRQLDEQANKIRTLIQDAEAHVAKNELTVPKGNNALVDYQKIFAIEPNNVKARQGVEYLSEQFLSRGYDALEKNNESLANRALRKLRMINDESVETSEFTDALASWKQKQQINKLLASAKQAIIEQRLLLPAGDNALYLYQQILLVDNANVMAIGGVDSIANIYIEKTNAAILAGQYETATGYLATVSVIDPKHPSISLIEEIIRKAQSITADTENDVISQAESQRNPAHFEPTINNGTARNSDVVSNNPTPTKEAAEQAAFDRQYLQGGLDAYYRGDYPSAAALLKPLADKGVSRAQFRIGYMYYLGRGFNEDRVEADRVIRAALPAIQTFAEQGRDWAQSDLGSLYEDGLVLPRDYAEAVFWYRSAAEQGYPGAQTNLGIMYARGRGVATSRSSAIEWFQRAAKQGDISAKHNLETMGVEP